MQIEQNKMWDKFYAGNEQVFFPSEFAKSVLPQLKRGRSVLDVGCGNGRDSIFFAQNGLDVTAIDMSREAIAQLVKREPKIHSVCGDVLTATIFTEQKYDSIYSRFFIHALAEEQEAALLERCYIALRMGGQLFIETRCTQDELCGVGDRLSDTEWVVDGHYRRFIVPEQLTAQLSSLGFVHIQSECARGLAPFDSADPVILRVTAEKGRLVGVSPAS